MATVLSWGYNFVAIKITYRQMLPSVVALSRFVVMFAALIMICVLVKQPLKYPPLRQTLHVLGIGFLSMGVYMVFFLEGLQHTSPGEAAILISSAPIFTSIFAILMRLESFHAKTLIGAIIALVGVGFVVNPAHHHAGTTLAGILMSLFAAILWGLNAAWTRAVIKDYNPLQLLTLCLPGALVILVPYAWNDLAKTQWGTLTPVTWWNLAHMCFLAGLVGFLGFNTGVKQIGASKAMLYQFFVPPISMLCTYFFLGQVPLWTQYLGVLIITVGVYVSNSHKYELKPQKPELDTALAD